MKEVLDNSLIVLLLSIGAFLLFSVVSSVVYDLKTSRTSQHSLKNKSRKRPKVTIILWVNNNEHNIEKSLKSIYKNNYRKIELIIINNASSDDSKNIINNFKKAYPKRDIRIINKRKSGMIHKSSVEAYKKYGHGIYVLFIEAGNQISGGLIRSGVSQLNSYEHLQAVSFNSRTCLDNTLSSLIQCFYLLCKDRVSKIYNLLKINGDLKISNRLIRNKIFLQTIKDPVDTSGVKAVYDSSEYVSVKPVNSFYQLYQVMADNLLGFNLQQIIRIIFVFVLILISTVTGIATIYSQWMLITLLWLSLVLTIGFYLVTSEVIKWHEKLQLAVYLPISFIFLWAFIITNLLKALEMLGRKVSLVQS